MLCILYNWLPPIKALHLNFFVYFIIEAETERNNSSPIPEMATFSNSLATLEEKLKEVGKTLADETRKEEKQLAHEETIATENIEEELNTCTNGGD
jgi:hypothetical protein